MEKIKSRPILHGEQIGILAPGSPVHSEAELEKAVLNLSSLGYPVVLGPTVTPRDGYLAGDDIFRQQDLEKMWRDKNIAAIWCLRGGFGCLRLLNRLNYGYFAKTPKALIGFSDITALELAVWAKEKLVTFHGPVLTELQSEFSRKCAWRMLSGELKSGDGFELRSVDAVTVLRNGAAEGILLGGNLATMSSLIGTGYLPDFRGVVLFIEEVGEAAYRIDRMLTQLTLNGIFDEILGIMIGRCIPVEGETEAELIRVIDEKFHNLQCPIGYGFPIGHLPEQWTVPQGIKVSLDLVQGEITLLESPWMIT
jgi:muramoyltetrapeptide carboxypeptidase